MIAADPHDIKDAIRTFVQSSVATDDVEDDTDLFESGIVNSLFAVQLMTFLERTFGVEVAMEDLDAEHFKSLNATTAFVVRKRARAAL